MGAIEERLVDVPVPAGDIYVPYDLRSYVKDLDSLSNLEPIGIYSTAQKIKRKLGQDAGLFTHKEQEELAEKIMSFTNPYWLCRNNIFHVNLSPEDKLKLIAELGEVAESAGMSTVVVPAEEALTNEKPQPIPEDWYDARFQEMMSEFDSSKLFVEVLTKKPAIKLLIRRKVRTEKYHYEMSRKQCGLPKMNSILSGIEQW
jgi:hypothetical protein